MGQWWGEDLNHEFNKKIVANVRHEFGPRYRCPEGHFEGWWKGGLEDLLEIEVGFLNSWEEYKDGHSRVRVEIWCLDRISHETPFTQFDIDVKKETGELIHPEIPLPQAA